MSNLKNIRFIFYEALVPTVVINAVINCANYIFELGPFENPERVMIWGLKGIGTDMVVTAFMCPFITSAVLILVFRLAYKNGKVQQLERVPPLIEAFPHNVFGAALIIGFLFVSVFGGLIAVIIGLLDAESLTPVNAFAIKTGFTSLVASAVVPLIALVALKSISLEQEKGVSQ